MPVRAEIRKNLKKSGHWSEFVEIRTKHEQEQLVSDPNQAALDDISALYGAETVYGSSPSVNARGVPRPIGVPGDPSKGGAHPDAQAVFGDLDYTRWSIPKRANLLADVNWAYQRIYIPLDSIDPYDAPSPGALGFLMYARANSGMFLKDFMSNFRPSKAQLDADSKWHDTGQDVTDLCDRLLEEAQKAEALESAINWDVGDLAPRSAANE